MNGYGNSVFLRTAWEVSGGVPPVNTVAPAITGTAQEGQTVTCSTGTWTGTPTITFGYQWKRNGSNIGSATNSTYVLVTADVSQSITCQVTATNGSGSASATSNTITPIAALDPDAQAFITAAAITNPTQQAAINTLVVDLKGYSIWSKMRALYPFVGGTNDKHSWNLKNTAQFQISWFGGVTSSANGVQGNGTNGYGNTGFNPLVNSTQNNSHVSTYLRTNQTGSSLGIFTCASDFSSINNNFGLGKYNGGADVRGYIGSGLSNGASYSSNNRGLWTVSTNGSTQQELYENSTVRQSVLYNQTLPNFNITLGAGNYGSGGVQLYTTNQFAFASIGEGMSSTQMANLYTAVQAFQTTLGRQV
jgi:hypothetical protein